MKTISKAISRSLMTLAVAGLGLALTPRTASAEITFEVNETVVPGTAAACGVVDCVFDADVINGFYTEVLTITDPGGGADFDFDVSALASFDAYELNGFGTGTGLIGTNEAINVGGYDMYATLEGSGTVDPTTGVITFTSANVVLYLDPNQDSTFTSPATGSGSWGITQNGADLQVMSSSTLLDGGGGFDPGEDGGFFDLDFGNIILTAFGDTYFSNLDTFSFLISTVDGDFNEVPNPPVPGTYDPVIGDLSIVYDGERIVPEPATLTLFGLGLLGSGLAVRRRRPRK